jgi:hypothetical protein
MSSRPDLYGTVHKGLRASLFATAALAGRTDFTRPAEAGEVAAAVIRLLGFLDEHAAHEDAVVMPVLATIAPELHADLRSEHARTDGLHRELAALAPRLGGASALERASLGRRLHDRLLRLAAEHVHHMQREEGDANRALWAHLDDAALAGLHGRVVGAIPPPRLAEWLALMLPAMSLPERAALLGGLRAQVPPSALAALVAPARVALGDEGWAHAAAAAGL